MRIRINPSFICSSIYFSLLVFQISVLSTSKERSATGQVNYLVAFLYDVSFIVLK